MSKSRYELLSWVLLFRMEDHHSPSPRNQTLVAFREAQATLMIAVTLRKPSSIFLRGCVVSLLYVFVCFRDSYVGILYNAMLRSTTVPSPVRVTPVVQCPLLFFILVNLGVCIISNAFISCSKLDCVPSVTGLWSHCQLRCFPRGQS